MNKRTVKKLTSSNYLFSTAKAKKLFGQLTEERKIDGKSFSFSEKDITNLRDKKIFAKFSKRIKIRNRILFGKLYEN